MANFRSQNIFSSCFSIFFSLFHFCTIFIPGASYDLPDHYFINCGSAHAQQRFTGDGFYSPDSKQVADNLNSSADDLYRNARIFRKPSWYEFSLNECGIYVVRLHFFPFPSIGNLSHARFSVSASHFLLLSNLDFGNKTHSNLLVEEFFMIVSKSKLRIDFVPDKEEHSFAFVNAIEVFLAPPNFIPDSATDGVVNFPLRVVHRINVGGGDVTRDTDTMLRYWIPDDPYLHLNNTARNNSYSGKIEYKRGLATQFDAPDSVYNTAKELNVGDNSMTNFNISWRFDVRNGAQHLLRLHFCDIVSVTSDEELKFNLYINSNSFFPISPYERSMNQLAVPFYNDYVVNSVDFGLMNISVGPDPGSQVRTAFLNGVEIMEVLRDRDGDSDSSRKRLLVVVGCVVLVVMMLTVLIICLREKKWKPIEEASEWAFVKIRGGSSQSKTSRTTVKTVTGSVHADLNLGLKVPLSAILFATRRFDAKLMIGEGGFGKVYKGKMRNGTKVAVKRSEAGHGQGLPEFQTEIMVLSKICHHHLVSLIGYCDEKNEMILVYEFMEKGSLRDHLYNLKSLSAPPSSRFSWDQRLRICIGAAKGLHYLHTGSVETIVHRDVKSTNILLDENYVAKVADFGLSRTGSLDQTHFSTEVKGSFGYLDPEYYTSLQLTQKSDVYSFGVVLLEVLCARPAVDRSLPKEQVNLANWGVSCKKKGELESIVDPFLLGKIDPNSLRVFGQTVEQCLQESGGDRPYMSDVLWSLEYCLQFQNRQPYEDSTTDVSLGLPARVVRRLPSNSMSISEDEVAFRHCSFSDESELSASVVF